MIKYCDCVSFYYPIPADARACNSTELQCLAKNKKDIFLSSTTIQQRCYPHCDGNTINV